MLVEVVVPSVAKAADGSCSVQMNHGQQAWVSSVSLAMGQAVVIGDGVSV